MSDKTTRKFIVRELEKEDFVHQDAFRAVSCWFVHHNAYGGWMDDKLTIHVYDDGKINISQNDDFLYLESEVADLLRKVLNEMVSAKS